MLLNMWAVLNSVAKCKHCIANSTQDIKLLLLNWLGYEKHKTQNIGNGENDYACVHISLKKVICSLTLYFSSLLLYPAWEMITNNNTSLTCVEYYWIIYEDLSYLELEKC